MSHQNSKSPFEFTGGHLCLNFTNTVDNRKGKDRKELLTSYVELVLYPHSADVANFQKGGFLESSRIALTES